MSYSINLAVICGNIGRDAEIKYTPSGIAKTTFSVATTRRFKKGDEWVPETTWHNVVLWRNENLHPHLTKGKQVTIHGSISNRSYDGQDGQKRYISEIVAEDVVLGGGNKQSSGGGNFEEGEWSDTKPAAAPPAQSRAQAKPVATAEPWSAPVPAGGGWGPTPESNDPLDPPW